MATNIKQIKTRKPRLGYLSDEERKRRISNTHEASAMRAANKVRSNRAADPEYVRQFEEAFMKPRMGGGKRTKQQR